MPSTRPVTISELAIAAAKDPPLPGCGLKHYMRLAELHRRAGAACLGSSGSSSGGSSGADMMERGFIEYTRAATLIVEKIPMHRDYHGSLTVEQKETLAASGQDVLRKLDKLKTALVDRYERYSTSNTTTAGEMAASMNVTSSATETCLQMLAAMTPQDSSESHLSFMRQHLWRGVDLTGSVTKLDKYPIACGSSADIYGGAMGNSKVAIKIHRRMDSERQELEQTIKTLYEAVRSWCRVDHPNVLQFLGVSLDLGLSPALITPLCASGPVMKYLKVNPKEPLERLKMTIGVAEGLGYLHSQGIVHGNLCAKKVLIDENGLPVICGYGMFDILGASSTSTALLSSPIRFAAPEYFSDETGTSSVRTKAGDVYAFSMVTLEILSQLQPYHHLPTEHTVFKHLLRGGRPIRTNLDHRIMTDHIWSVLTSLWNEIPSSRPAMADVLVSLATIRFDDGHGDSGSHEITSQSDTVIGFRRFSRFLPTKLSSGEETTFEMSDSHVGDLRGRIKQDDPYPFAGGGNANIYRGKMNYHGRKIRVAIKMIRVSDDGSGQLEGILKRLKREVEIWKGLRHKNILRFIGVCEDLAPLPVLISPLYKFGHVLNYLRMHPVVDKRELALGVGSGLEFLHDNHVVHGDLKVQNVLVNKHGVPCICDFGISKILGRQGYTTSNVGTAPYMAPELFFVVDGLGTSSQTASPGITTKSSDVYSFALLVLEILTVQPPKARPNKPIVTAKIIAGLRPKLADYDESLVSQRTWFVLDQCWSFNPLIRPSISEVLLDLTESFHGDPQDLYYFDLTPGAEPHTSLSLHAPEHGCGSFSKGQIHIKLVQLRNVHVSYIVVQFEKNEFIIRDLTGEAEDVKPSLAAVTTSGEMSALGAIGNNGAAAEASKKERSNLSFTSSVPAPALTGGGLFGQISAHNPVWKHQVSFDVTAEASLITFHVYNHRSIDHGFLGTVQIKPVLVHDHIVDQWYKLRTCDDKVMSEEMRVQVTFEQYKTKRAPSALDFEYLKVICYGTFGKVFQVRKKDTKRIYAMKVLSKEEIVAKNKVAKTISELKNVQYSLQSPFLVGFRFSFQTDVDLYVVADFRHGDELLWHLQRERCFSEERTRFHIAELILALEHLHKYDIVYRDLNPENILLDATGHIALSDVPLFNVEADPCSDKLTPKLRGMPEYLAPEILSDAGYSKTADFWSLGVIFFEMVCEPTLFKPKFWLLGRDAPHPWQEITDLVPRGAITEDGMQFLKGLLTRDPKRRLGAVRDAEELKEDPFFSSIDWKALALKQITPPFRFIVKSDESITKFDEISTSANLLEIGPEDRGLDFDEGDLSEDWLGSRSRPTPALQNRNGYGAPRRPLAPQGIDIEFKNKRENLRGGDLEGSDSMDDVFDDFSKSLRY